MDNPAARVHNTGTDVPPSTRLVANKQLGCVRLVAGDATPLWHPRGRSSQGRGTLPGGGCSLPLPDFLGDSGEQTSVRSELTEAEESAARAVSRSAGEGPGGGAHLLRGVSPRRLWTDPASVSETQPAWPREHGFLSQNNSVNTGC